MLTLDYTLGLSQFFLNNFPQLPYKLLHETLDVDNFSQAVQGFRTKGGEISKNFYVTDMTTVSQKSELYQLLQSSLDTEMYTVFMLPCTEETFSLQDKLDIRIQRMVCPILYLVDDVSQLVGLSEWADVRHHPQDLVIDLNSNIIPMLILSALPSLDYDETSTEMTAVFSEPGQSCDVTLRRNSNSTAAEKE